jgi:5-formyltetrahydrofolate cyclo-ligase
MTLRQRALAITPAQRAKSGRAFWKMRGELVLLTRLAQARFCLPAINRLPKQFNTFKK